MWSCRVKAGEWLGPWVLCHTLEAVMKKMEPASLNVHVHVVSQPGGAVPVLYTARYACCPPPPSPVPDLCNCSAQRSWPDTAAGSVLTNGMLRLRPPTKFIVLLGSEQHDIMPTCFFGSWSPSTSA